jgi:hypothetical protein
MKLSWKRAEKDFWKSQTAGKRRYDMATWPCLKPRGDARTDVPNQLPESANPVLGGTPVASMTRQTTQPRAAPSRNAPAAFMALWGQSRYRNGGDEQMFGAVEQVRRPV